MKFFSVLLALLLVLFGTASASASADISASASADISASSSAEISVSADISASSSAEISVSADIRVSALICAKDANTGEPQTFESSVKMYAENLRGGSKHF